MKQSSLLVLNTAVTYGRMAVTIVIGLIATRLLLHLLGNQDFGLLTALGASGMLGPVITSAMRGAAARHLAYEVGRGDADALAAMFHTSQAIFAVWALGLLLVGAALAGPLFGAMTIPPERVDASHWVYALVLGQMAVMVWNGPYSALLVAHQAMVPLAGFTALTSLADLALIVVLAAFQVDHLVAYAAWTFGVRTGLAVALMGFAWRRYPETRPSRRRFVRADARRLGAFAGWSVLGFVSQELRMQGALLVVNSYFGPVANAAYAIAVRVATYLQNFGGVAQTVIQPAMTATEAQGHVDKVHRMVGLGSKVPLTICLALFVPIAVEAPTVLGLWLVDVPPGSALFVRLVAAATVLFFVVNGYGMALVAKARIGAITAINLTIQLVALGLAITLFETLGGEAWWLAAVNLGAVAVTVLVYPLYIGAIIHYPARRWARDVAAPSALAAALVVAAATGAHEALQPGLARLLAVTAAVGLTAAVAGWWVILDRVERRLVLGVLARVRGRLFSS